MSLDFRWLYMCCVYVVVCSLTHILVVCLSFCHVAASQVDEHSFLQVSRSSECEFHVWHGFFVVVCLGVF